MARSFPGNPCSAAILGSFPWLDLAAVQQLVGDPRLPAPEQGSGPGHLVAGRGLGHDGPHASAQGVPALNPHGLERLTLHDGSNDRSAAVLGDEPFELFLPCGSGSGRLDEPGRVPFRGAGEESPARISQCVDHWIAQ